MTVPTPSDVFDDPVASCPLCGSERIRHRHIIRRYDPVFRIDRCDSCGFMFMNPRLREAAARVLYDEDYYSGKAAYSYYDERASEESSRIVWDKRISVIRRHVAGGNILDVGSSFGGFLKSASRYFAPHGIEVSSYAGGYSKSVIGGAIHIGTLRDHPFREDYFSVITMIELLEHLPDPVFALHECYRLLRTGGLLLIQTANMAGLQAKIQGKNYAYFMPGHLSYFSMRNLAMALMECGFRKIKVFHPVEFGLLPKLKKSRRAFTSFLDYRHWLRIAAYHYVSKIRCGDFAATSSMVIYAFK
jgi:2-polyprenyl-3-methyl-5-hydroxy-6-metoxy-1,4-benzoquinol methylase